MRSKCRDIHHSSNLPSILDSYLAPVGVRKAKNEDKAQYWMAMVVQGNDHDQEAKARRQAQLEQRHLEAYRNMHRLSDALHHRYADLLRKKLHSQRLELQRRYETSRTKSGNETKQKQGKLTFSILQHSDSYLTSLPKTRYYLILDLQNQLAQSGYLKTHQDLEDFSRSAADVMTQQKTRGSRRISVTAEDKGHADRVSCSRLPSLGSFIERGPGSGETSTDMLLSCRQDQQETEQMFPKMKVPTFVTLQPNFLRNLKSKIPGVNIPEIPEKSRKAELHLRRLRQMHDTSLTNMAVSRRLLDRERDSLCWQEERSVQDLMPSVFPSISSKQENPRHVFQAPLQPLTQSRIGQNDQPQPPQQLSRKTSASYHYLGTRFMDADVGCTKTPDPLSMEDVCQQKHVEIIDHRCKLWSNYAEDSGY